MFKITHLPFQKSFHKLIVTISDSHLKLNTIYHPLYNIFLKMNQSWNKFMWRKLDSISRDPKMLSSYCYYWMGSLGMIKIKFQEMDGCTTLKYMYSNVTELYTKNGVKTLKKKIMLCIFATIKKEGQNMSTINSLWISWLANDYVPLKIRVLWKNIVSFLDGTNSVESLSPSGNVKRPKVWPWMQESPSKRRGIASHSSIASKESLGQRSLSEGYSS